MSCTLDHKDVHHTSSGRWAKTCRRPVNARPFEVRQTPGVDNPSAKAFLFDAGVHPDTAKATVTTRFGRPGRL